MKSRPLGLLTTRCPTKGRLPAVGGYVDGQTIHARHHGFLYRVTRSRNAVIIRVMERPAAQSAPRTSALDLLWQPMSVMWVMLAAEALAIILSLAPGLQANRWVYFGLMSLLLQWIALLSLGVAYLFRLPLSRLQRPGLAWAMVGLLIATTSLLGAFGWVFLPRGMLEPDTNILAAWLRIIGLVTVAGVLGALAFQNHWLSRQAAMQAKQSQLDALRARVNPHFLFNTLNTASALVHGRPDQAESILLDLSDLFRAALSDRSEHPVTDEVALVQRYLEIERLRLGERLQVDWERPDMLPADTLPVLSIQPLVENAVRHGIEALPDGGRLRISINASPNELLLRVANPMPVQPTPRSEGHQVGLAATRVRIESFTAGAGRLDTRQENGEFVAEIALPRRLGTAA